MGMYQNEAGIVDTASLADNHCGSVTLYGGSGATFSINLSDDPEYMMSGLYEPDSSFDRW